MQGLNLPALSTSASPEFITAQGCAEWLQSVPLINVGPSHGRLLAEIEELNSCDIAVAERMRILETLLEPVLFVQSEHAKKFSSRAVPLSKQEREILLSVTALWNALGMGYQRCLQTLAGVAPGLVSGSTQLALACQRALWCASQVLQEHYKCYLGIGIDGWSLLHRLYVFAEERKLAGDPVDHPVHKANDKTSCMDIYAQSLLLNAINPNEQTSRQMIIAARWLDLLGHKVVVTPKRPAHRESDPQYRPLGAELAGDCGPIRVEAGAESPTLRFLDVEDLSNSIRKRVALLRKGDSPATLGLGEDLAPQVAEQLLLNLHRMWCEDKQSRSLPRKNAPGIAEVSAGMASLHFQVSGRPFRQPSNATELSKSQREEIATFGRLATRDEDEYSRAQSKALETWQVIDESLAGLRLERLSGEGRFVHAQLVASRPKDAKMFMLGTIRWMAVDANYVVKLGVRLIPGVPRAIAIRATGLNAMNDKYVPALALSAVPALKSPESLVLPVGWFKPQRVIEAYSEQARNLRLTGVLDRGTDFERVSFEPT